MKVVQTAAPSVLVIGTRLNGPAAGSSKPRLDVSSRVVIVSLASVLVVTLLTWHTPQSVYMDPAWQLNALRQYVSGQSPNFNTLVQANPKDLSRDHLEWISQWPPLMGLIILALTRVGVSILLGVRMLAIAGLAVGSIGWGLWAERFAMPRWVVYCIAAGTPFIRYANNPLFSYYTEGLAFAMAPWMLICAERLVRRWALPTAVATGVLLGAAYWAKYSLAFVSVGALAFLFWRVRWRALWAAIPCMALMLALNQLNRTMGAAASIVSQGRIGVVWNWRVLVAPFSFLPLGMADLDAMLHYLFMSPEHPWEHAEAVIYLGTLPGVLLLAWLLRPARDEEWLSISVALASMGSLIALWLTVSTVGYEVRYIASAAMALLPFAAASAYRKWPAISRGARCALVAAALVYIVVPTAYGAVTVFGKRSRVSVFPLRPAPRMDVVYAADPVIAFGLDGRKVITEADFESESTLRSQTYHTSVPLSIGVVLPVHFEGSGKGELIRKSFPQAREWQGPVPLTSAYQVWVAQLIPDEADTTAASKRE